MGKTCITTANVVMLVPALSYSLICTGTFPRTVKTCGTRATVTTLPFIVAAGVLPSGSVS